MIEAVGGYPQPLRAPTPLVGGGRSRIGPLKKGTMMGYTAKGKTTTRRNTLRKLNAVSVYTKRTAPKTSRTFRRDRNWVRKTFLSRKSK